MACLHQGFDTPGRVFKTWGSLSRYEVYGLPGIIAGLRKKGVTPLTKSKAVKRVKRRNVDCPT